MMLNSTAIEGLKRFLQHAGTLSPKNNPRGENGFAKEFQEIKDLTSRLKKDPNFSTKHGEKEINRPKNRYKDILPYDYTRVILPDNGTDGSDYINANYIKGPTNKVVYLTAQGPLNSTVEDFWRMIVSHKIQVIVMACREYELGKLKCKRYWPENMEETLELGGCKISLISQEEMGDGFIIRTLSAKRAKEELKVTQFHYTAWPDHDVPRSATPLIELTMSFRAFVGSDNKVPVLVHCSAGCGRTGTICALDYARSLIQMGRTENFSVYDIVTNLRKQRIAMVQTKEQYELVYKAVKELVNDELKKQRVGGPSSYYVNVEIGKEPKEDNTYENVDFIRSIQRLHQEEKNAARKPLPLRETPTPSSMAVVPAPRKDVVLATKNIENKPSQWKDASKENLPQSSAKPRPNQKPSSGYENVLPLSCSSKPPLAPRPAQNYVNVVIGTSNETNDDYVNVISSIKTVPVPTEKVDPGTKPLSKPFPTPEPRMDSTGLSPLNPEVAKKLTTKKDTEYEIPPKIQSQVSTESDYVISPVLVKTGAKTQQQVDEGKLIDLDEPQTTSSPTYPLSAYKNKLAKISSFENEPKPNQETSDKQASKNNRPTSAECKQVKTKKPSGQHSLVGAESPGSPGTNVIKNPFDGGSKEAQIKGRDSLITVEEVMSDGSSVNPPAEKTIISPRLNEGSNLASKKSDQDSFFGCYSIVNEKAVAKEKENVLKSQPSCPDVEKPLQQTLLDTCHSNSSRHIHSATIQKAYSTENVNTGISGELSSLDSNLSDYSMVSSPYFSKKSGASTSALYSSADNEGPTKMKPTAVLRRSNSGVVTPSSSSTGDVDGLYATVGSRTKKRPPLSTVSWTTNGHLPSQERELKRSINSTSSLRSVNSTSSNDSFEDVPPVPVKTINAFLSPGDEDAYETVRSRSLKSSTMDRFKAKARNMINSGTQVSKISIGKKNPSPASTPRSASPVLGEGTASYTSSQLGYGKRVSKPSGPRTCPGHWPNFT